MFHVIAALAEFEHDVIRERTLAGLDAARARGETQGDRNLAPGPGGSRKGIICSAAEQRCRDHDPYWLQEPGDVL